MTDGGQEPGGAKRCSSDYLQVTPPNPGCARIRFTGPFEGQMTLWDATVMTLAHYREFAGGAAAGPALRQFIEVGPQQGRMRRLVIALNVPEIDTPVLLKTIIMVRKYKRLRRGRHEYGTPWHATRGQPHGA